MPTKIKRGPPLESFSPEIRALLERGTRERFQFDARKKGPVGSEAFLLEMNRFTSLRQRMNQFRVALREHDPEGAAHLYKCVVSIYSKNSPLYGLMVIGPRDDQFADLMKESGTSVPALDDDWLASASGIAPPVPEEKK